MRYCGIYLANSMKYAQHIGHYLPILLWLMSANTQADSQLDLIYKIPDFSQIRVMGESFGNGQQFCGPVAVSNSLHWLMPGQMRQLALIKILASKNYMNTSLENGTGTSGLLRGVDRYVTETIGGFKKLHYQGWRLHPRKYSTRIKIPSLQWIISGVKPNATVWLNIGWYEHDKETDQFRRIGGHWVTVVGYDFNPEKQQLVIHDPSPRAGDRFVNHYVSLRRITQGTLIGDKKGLPISAAGFVALVKGLPLKAKADVAVIDGAVILEL